MSFEVFDKKAVPSTKDAWITIQKRGNFSLNGKAVEDFGKPEAVELLYDRERKLIAFRPATGGTPRAFPLRQQGKSGAHLVAGRAFTQHYKIATEEARRYKPRLQEGMLVIDLKGEYAVATGPRYKGDQDD